MEEEKSSQTEERSEFKEIVVEIKRTAKKTQGGDRMAFSCLAVVGNKAGMVGSGLGKAPTVRDAVKKAIRKAKRQMISFPLRGRAKTIPHEVRIYQDGCEILLMPAPEGTGIRAGGAMRSVLEAGGVENVVARRIGSRNKQGNVNAVLTALQELKELDKRVYKMKDR
jgi:small subunit ribosomal protein S5